MGGKGDGNVAFMRQNDRSILVTLVVTRTFEHVQVERSFFSKWERSPLDQVGPL